MVERRLNPGQWVTSKAKDIHCLQTEFEKFPMSNSETKVFRSCSAIAEKNEPARFRASQSYTTSLGN